MALPLADGSIWNIAAEDERTFALVRLLAETMRLRPQTELGVSVERDGIEPASCRTVSSLRLVVQEPNAHHSINKGAQCARASNETLVLQYIGPKESASTKHPAWTAGTKKSANHILGPAVKGDIIVGQMKQIMLVIAQHVQRRGGLLLHGALAEKDGGGVILAGSGGAGKTTASWRLPPPWHSLCDDATLVVCDSVGRYWAHPWPTWSSFMFDGAGGSWDVQHAVPLKGIFFLEQAQLEEFKPFGTAQAICSLIELTEQVSWPMSNRMEIHEKRVLRLQRFENACALGQTVSCYILRLSRHGAFWEQIEKALKG
jgi:hypothetical protein